MTFHNPFAPRRPRSDPPGARLKLLVRQVMGLGDAVSVAVTEVDCRHTECGGGETLVLIDLSVRDLRVLRFDKPASEVSEEDVRAAVAGSNTPSNTSDDAE